jgi:hypothetical protein
VPAAAHLSRSLFAATAARRSVRLDDLDDLYTLLGKIGGSAKASWSIRWGQAGVGEPGNSGPGRNRYRHTHRSWVWYRSPCRPAAGPGGRPRRWVGVLARRLESDYETCLHSNWRGSRLVGTSIVCYPAAAPSAPGGGQGQDRLLHCAWRGGEIGPSDPGSAGPSGKGSPNRASRISDGDVPFLLNRRNQRPGR